ncbi:MAG: SRPBCC family protein [Limisphaerales bacterium]
MNTNNDAAGKFPGLKLTVSRIINAPCEMLFRAWTEPEQLSQWFSPQDAECRQVSADVRVGGAFRIHMVSKTGDHVAIGKYTEIVPNKRLKFTWQWESYAMPNSVVTVDFEDLGAKTLLILKHAGLPDQEDLDQHSHGWNSLVEKFGKLMEQEKITA